MDKRIVLASAGAGKTFYVANDFKAEERVILISFTNSNVANIRKEIHKRFNGEVPENVQIMTYDSFIYNNLLKPVEPLFLSNISTKVNIKDKPVEDPRVFGYKRVDTHEHYMDSNNAYYVNRMAKLFLTFYQNEKNIVLDRLYQYCDAIYFDEFQDYNGYDFKLLKFFLEKSKLKVVAVGDINQSCITPLRSAGNNIAKNPFHKIKNVDDLKKLFSDKVHFDEITLEETRRVPKITCEMIKVNLNINIVSKSDVDASIIYLKNIDEINDIVTNVNIPKLIWDKRTTHPIGKNYVNWTYSKGDTYPTACVILTNTVSNIEKWTSITSLKTRNSLYVALTRSKGDLYLITSNDYKKWRKHADSKQRSHDI
ncbi:UvrD-helicase domain-containing protein [Jeotgalicoccus halotolerans]|uniref:UvrD-helicase domain-containing protein n=1 Tax=Jeotgalicoccus halotolerans TaxID=157227 RepID=UPI003517792D